jgi:transketolase
MINKRGIMVSADTIKRLKARAYNLRVLSLKATTEAGSGHPTSALSAADIVAALFFHAMQFNTEQPDAPDNDRFILSKGHAAPVLYAAWEQVGVLTESELMTLRHFSSVLEGHPTARFAYTEAATGSLGCGLSIGLGMALSSRLSKQHFYTYVLLGDSEMAEGSNWEAIEIAAHYKTDNLIAIVDLNRLGQSTETLDDHHLKQHVERWQAFGWHTICIDGHVMEQVVAALDEARSIEGRPTVIVAYTIKGYGLAGIENKEGYHGKAFSKEQLPKLLNELAERFPEEAHMQIERVLLKPGERKRAQRGAAEIPLASYKIGELVATRKAFGQTLTLLGDYYPEIVSLDAEVKNSTFAELFERRFPERFVQCFVAEQNMIGMAVGFASRHYIPFASTFACFLSRAHDQIRMAATGRAALRLVGSHAGVSIGQDGPSQMGLEDIALMRALPDSIVLYPCDAVSTYGLTHQMALYEHGMSYLRLTRMDTPVIYDAKETFKIGGCKVLRESDNDVACIVAAGITVFEALKAYEELKAKNISVSIIDLYSIKPLDADTLKRIAKKSRGRVITIEDHFIQGGLGEAVCYELRNEDCRIELLAVKELSRSGKPEELLAYHRIDATAIIESVFALLV